MKKKFDLRKLQAVTLAVVLSAVSLSVYGGQKPVEAKENLNTHAGYMLRNALTGKYLTVANASVQSGADVCQYMADGVADYNTWYFTETENGEYTIKSALDQGQFYISSESGSRNLEISDSNVQSFSIRENDNGSYSFIISGENAMTVPSMNDGDTIINVGLDGNESQDWYIEAVTNLKRGDINKDGVVNAHDYSLLKAINMGRADTGFIENAIADINGDGKFSHEDLTELQKYIFGQEEYNIAEATLPKCDVFPKVEITETTETTTTTVTEPTETTVTTVVTEPEETTITTTDVPKTELTLADMPSNYEYPVQWIWENRIVAEKSTVRRNTIFDQIVAGDGTLNFVVRWQSYKPISLEQRKQLLDVVDKSVNAWTDYLVGYDGWKYDHIDVKIVGWAVLDKSVLTDLQPDEIVYDNLISDYDSSGDTSNGVEEIPKLLPSAPDELSRMYHFDTNTGFDYPGGLDKRFDMYLWATQGFPSIGGCGGDWGQRLSDDAYLNMLSGSGIHVLQHEIGHGFGMTDFYGGEGESNGFPPGGFPNENKSSIMMAGSSMEITDFDGWLLRYMWSQIKDDEGRFN